MPTECRCTTVPAKTYWLPKADKAGRETVEDVESAHEAEPAGRAMPL
jgi:hypothetical protein